jgi:hypothetical protein
VLELVKACPSKTNIKFWSGALKKIHRTYIRTLILSFFFGACSDSGASLRFAPMKLLEESAEQFTLKEVQLDSQSFVQNRISVSGILLDIGSYNTYILLTDGHSRLLVETTTIQKSETVPEFDIGQKVRVQGRVQKHMNYIVLVSDQIEIIK